MTDVPRLLVLSAYEAASHARWRKTLMSGMADWTWQALTLPPRYFRWRIRGNPLSWLNEASLDEQWDLVVATSMVDLATLRGLHPRLAGTPAILYFHENQFAYPGSDRQHDSIDPAMVNLYAALSADRLVFNSDWNRRSFLAGVEQLLQRLPDAVPAGIIDRLGGKASILPVPLETDVFRPHDAVRDFSRPHVLWNHRWEYDKGPEVLLAFVEHLKALKQPFSLSVVGEGFRRCPAPLTRLREAHSDVIHHWGFIPEVEDYRRLLAQADLVLSTAWHDFQGLSVQEAMAAGCLPWVPDRLAYPEYVPNGFRYPAMEDATAQGQVAAENLVSALAHWRAAPPAVPDISGVAASALLPRYRSLFDSLLR